MTRLSNHLSGPAALILIVALLSPLSGRLRAQDFPLVDDDVKLVTAPTTDSTRSFLFDSDGPESVEQLRLMEQVFADVADRLAPATVNIALEEAQGSGVVVSRDGYILTAAHVIGRPNQSATITFPDGSKVKAVTLGVNRSLDSGMLKITEDGKWPFVDIGESEPLQKGQWVMAVGHPGGLTEGRGLVYRAGRILNNSDRTIVTDCTLVGGDSGGPLVDLNGSVIGIHSRIGGRLWENFHVPIDGFSVEWDKLVEGHTDSGKAHLGIELSRDDNRKITNQIESVDLKGAAEKAGMKSGDIVIKINDAEVTDGRTFGKALNGLKPEDKAVITVKRGDEELALDVILGYK